MDVVKFSTTMFQMGTNTGIEVPAEVVAALDAGKRPPVVVNVNGYEYRSTVAPMGGKYLLPFSADRRQESGIQGGDAIDVELTLDTAPRTVDVPDDRQQPPRHGTSSHTPTGKSMCGPCSTPRRPKRGHGASPPSSPGSKVRARGRSVPQHGARR